MSDDYTLFERGHTAILAALEQGAASLNVDVLAQACAHKARDPSSSRAESLGWADAALACYAKAAAPRPAGYARQGSEVPLFGVMGLMILRWGPEIGSRVLDLARLTRWIQDELDAQESLDQFRAALMGDGDDNQREHAFCLKERLWVGAGLYERGLLPASFAPWFQSAGFNRPAE